MHYAQNYLSLLFRYFVYELFISFIDTCFILSFVTIFFLKNGNSSLNLLPKSKIWNINLGLKKSPKFLLDL